MQYFVSCLRLANLASKDYGCHLFPFLKIVIFFNFCWIVCVCCAILDLLLPLGYSWVPTSLLFIHGILGMSFLWSSCFLSFFSLQIPSYVKCPGHAQETVCMTGMDVLICVSSHLQLWNWPHWLGQKHVVQSTNQGSLYHSISSGMGGTYWSDGRMV